VDRPGDAVHPARLGPPGERPARVERPPAPAEELALRDTLIRLTYPFNATGWPACALPCGPAEDGLPASVQFAAPPGRDALVLAAAAALERALSLD
jgi:Asp-tRNA(Asn)/Glu-tRNA(Gln) amidotransferase A subunit family amidase